MRSPAFLAILVSFSVAVPAHAFDQTHAQWTKILQEHVVIAGHASRIRYRELADKPTALNAYLTELQSVSSAEYAKFSDAEKLAFLINSFNAFTLKLIVNHYPVGSVREIVG